MSPQVAALLHSIKATRAEMPSLARDGGKIYRRLPVPQQAEWMALGLPDALLTEPAGAIRAAVVEAANRKESA